MSRVKRFGIAGLVAIPAILLVYIVTDSTFETRLPAREGGALIADLALGSGLSFDRGSLEIRSHGDDDVRVVTKVWGWGKYAVDVQARERDGDVQVEGRVEGPLYWMFAGPTVDLQIFVPDGYGVEAHVDGGPLLLEELSGPIEAHAAAGGRNTITLRRSRGVAKLVGHDSKIRVDDVRGELKIETVAGQIEVTDVNGTMVVTAQEGASIRIEDVRGDIHAASEYGNIRVKAVVGDVDLETEDGRVEVKALDGRVRARSRHGDIAVEFHGNPSGSIETEGGSIDVEVPASAGFDLDVIGREDAIDLDRELDFVRIENPQDAIGPLVEQDIEDFAQLGGEVASEVHQKLSDRIRQYLAKRRRGEDGSETWDEAWNWSWDDPNWRWYDHPWALGRHRGGWGGRGNAGAGAGVHLAGQVNGGGDELEIRTQGGRVKIKD